MHVRIAAAAGSSPRETGAQMFVSPSRTCGTIGGGQLEYMAIDQARKMLSKSQNHTQMDVPLGPEIGQCCGGRVVLELARLHAGERGRFLNEADEQARAWPQVLVFGAGHVGRALARALAPLPVRLKLVDSRAEELDRAELWR